MLPVARSPITSQFSCTTTFLRGTKQISTRGVPSGPISGLSPFMTMLPPPNHSALRQPLPKLNLPWYSMPSVPMRDVPPGPNMPPTRRGSLPPKICSAQDLPT